MNRIDYERHLIGLLCWRCHEATRLSYRRQRRYPACHHKWSYHYRRLEWELLKAFCLAATPHQAARVVDCSYPTAARVYHRCREALGTLTEAEKRPLLGQLELDESYFGGRRKGRRGRGTPARSPFWASWSEQAEFIPSQLPTARKRR